MRQRSSSQTKLPFSQLESRNLLASIAIAPVDATLASVGGSYLEYGTNGSHWYDGSGLSDPTAVESGAFLPNELPTHISGNSNERVSRIRAANDINTLTFDLGGTFDVSGMILWNSSEIAGDGTPQTDRGFNNTTLSYSTDGGATFTGSDTLTWSQVPEEDSSTNQGSNPSNPVVFSPELQMLPGVISGVTHIRMDVDNFSTDGIVMASELRFIGDEDPPPAVADLSATTRAGTYNFEQGIEGSRNIELTVTLDQPNATGAAITFDLDDLGTGTAIAGEDYVAIADDAQISIPSGASEGTYIVNVIEDFAIEPTELLNFRISNPSDATVTIGTADQTATIGDNDAAGISINGADDLDLSEAGGTDTYTIALDSMPTGPVEITITADAQTRVSIDGTNFAPSQVISLSDMSPRTITVLAADDQNVEGDHSSSITHRITGTVVDPNYPDVTVEDLYTRTGPPDPTFQELIDSGQLPTGFNSTAGITGSTIDVNNAVLEQGLPANGTIPEDIRIHTLANSNIRRPFFDRWTRWYQEDGNTQVFRVFQGEENVRNDRELAARIEAFSPGWQKGVWNDFSARYTVLKPQSMSIFQSYQVGVEWSVHVGMQDDGTINFTHRRNYDGGTTRFILAEDMIGKSFDIRIRDNGHEYEVYFNGELKGQGYWERPNNDIAFRWGAYRGAREMTQDVLVFVGGVEMEADTSTPTGLMPYRLPTTSLSIDSVTVDIADNDDGTQREFIEQAVEDGTRVLAEEFDLGGQDIAYFDTTEGNRGNAARIYEDVDLFAGSIVLSDIRDGEWLEFTRDVVPGVYDIDIRSWSNNDSTKGVRLLVAEDADSTFTELGNVDISNTNNDRVSHTLDQIDLTEWGGPDRVFRVEFYGNNFSYDWFEFRAVGQAPNDIVLSDSALNENLRTDSDLFVADLTTSDPDSADAHTYSLVAGTGDGDNTKFNIVDDKLYLSAGEVLDYETLASYSIRLKTTDSYGLSFEKPVSIAVNNLVELTKSNIAIGESSSRSRISTASVTFDGPVTIQAGAFVVNKRGVDGGLVDVSFEFRPGSNNSIVDLTFSGSFVQNGSLVDGYYDLSILAGQVLSNTGHGLDVDGDGDASESFVFGDTAEDKFFRLFGDHNGDATVNVFDLLSFRRTYLLQEGDDDYLADFDSNSDGRINVFDLLAFRSNYRKTLNFN
jgi:hypothetical protein